MTEISGSDWKEISQVQTIEHFVNTPIGLCGNNQTTSERAPTAEELVTLC